MLSRLDSIFKTQFRHAENTDTRQAIQRREQDQRRKNEDDKPNYDESELWHDDITVSVASVKNILKQLTSAKPQDTASTTQPDDVTIFSPQNDPETDDSNPRSEQADKAAMAYKRTWQTTHPEETSFTPPPENLPDISLAATEMRMINDLIADLDTLLARDVHNLTLEKSDSFLQSLQIAVEKALG